MRIRINAEMTDGAWGGGNQFLKALRTALMNRNAYAEHPDAADAILFNGYQDVRALAMHFFTRPRQKRIYRLGPILSLHRPGIKWVLVDYLVVFFANWFADVVVFQSKWSYEQVLIHGFSTRKRYAIIGNAVNAGIFPKKQFQERAPGETIKLVYSSWSPNMNKGFAYLRYLDQHLDFATHSFTFIGNAPFAFRNITTLAPLPSHELAIELRRHHIFISPVKDDACSNALLEALSSGLPAVALESGGNPELVGRGGELFRTQEELVKGIEKVAKNLKAYYDAIRVRSIDEIASDYLDCLQSL